MKFKKYLSEGKYLEKDYQALGLKPVQAGDKRESDMIKAIEALAKKYKVGPLAPMRIDARGDITMLQQMINPTSYKQDEEIPQKLRDMIQKKYNKTYQGEVTSRWVKLNHFTWEKLLRDMGY